MVKGGRGSGELYFLDVTRKYNEYVYYIMRNADSFAISNPCNSYYIYDSIQALAFSMADNGTYYLMTLLITYQWSSSWINEGFILHFGGKL